MGVAMGALEPWSPQYVISINCLPFLPILQKGCTTVERQHGDVVDMQTIILY